MVLTNKWIFLIIISIFLIFSGDSQVIADTSEIEIIPNNWNNGIPAPEIITEKIDIKKTEILDSFTLAQKEAKKEGKPLIVIFHASWSSYSEKLVELFKNGDLMREFLKDYIVVIADSKAELKICDRYNIRAFPTCLILNSDNVILGEIRGFHEENSMISKIKEIK